MERQLQVYYTSLGSIRTMINNFDFIDTGAVVIALLFSLILHENAHGIAAYFMGDNTAKNSGRISMNPFKHLSLYGTISMILFKFGWAKPVPINPNNFKKKRLGNFLVSIAGILTNFLLAIISAFLFILALKNNYNNRFILLLLQYLIMYNIFLGIFNLIPIPPLDGSKIIYTFLPYKTVNKLYSIEKYSNIILIVLIMTGIIGKMMNYICIPIINWILGIFL